MITLPFTDVPASNIFFCSIAAAYFSGLTNGTSATTYSPTDPVLREQMAAFITRTLDQSLRRGSRRAAHNQFWTTTPQYTVMQGVGTLGTTALGNGPQQVASDGADLWVPIGGFDTVSRVRASDGKLLETWTGATGATGVLAVMGRVFVTSFTIPGNLYVIDPSQPAGAVTTLSSALGIHPAGIAFDGQRLWTANNGSVSIITPGSPFMALNVTDSFGDLNGILYDGANIWVAELGTPGLLKKLDASGVILQTVSVGNDPAFPVFDGTNIWVPNRVSNSVSVVRVKDTQGNPLTVPFLLATLTGNGLNAPISAAFDGQRILVTNFIGDSVSLFRAADFAPLGTVATGAGSFPFGACSDGLHFWITLQGPAKLARF